jgi:hypothetical protein
VGAAVFNGVDLPGAAPIEHNGLVPKGHRQRLIREFGALGHHVPVVGTQAQLPQGGCPGAKVYRRGRVSAMGRPTLVGTVVHFYVRFYKNGFNIELIHP